MNGPLTDSLQDISCVSFTFQETLLYYQNEDLGYFKEASVNTMAMITHCSFCTVCYITGTGVISATVEVWQCDKK